MNHDIEMIAHSCGVEHPRLLRREHCRIVQANGHSTSLKTLYPYPQARHAAARLRRRREHDDGLPAPLIPAQAAAPRSD
jgi:hypothetical protein